MNLESVKQDAVLKISRGAAVLKYRAPELMLFGGLILGVTTVILAAKATLAVEDITEEANDRLDNIEDHAETGKTEAGNPYSQEDAAADRTKVIVQTGLKFAKLYAPAIGTGVASVALILGAHGIMKRREVGLIAAYNAVSETFRLYRKHIETNYGKETEQQMFRGTVSEEQFDVVDDGEGGLTLQPKTWNGKKGSMYARFFDPTNPMWKTEGIYNLQFLRSQQNAANDYLRTRGHITLNQVYEMLGFDHSEAGFIVGWVYEQGDGYVSFGIDDLINTSGNVFQFNPGILLDFNVDGVIFDKLGLS